MLNVWTRLIVSLSQFSSKITRKSLYSSKRPWQGLLMQLFTLKFWFLNLKKYYLKQIKVIIRTQTLLLPFTKLTLITWQYSQYCILAVLDRHDRPVPASKLEWAAEGWAGKAGAGEWRTQNTLLFSTPALRALDTDWDEICVTEENIPRNSPGGWNVILEFSSRKLPSLRSSLNLTSCFPRGGYIKTKETY